MKGSALLAYVTLLVLLGTMAGCSVRVPGGAKVSSDGTVAILTGTESILIKAPQPPVPVTDPLPPKPKKTLRARVSGERIELVGRLVFDEGNDLLKAESCELLLDLSRVLAEHDDIKKLRIEGHTDESGDDVRDRELSLKRAAAVKSFLREAGIDESRLMVVGYGGERPCATNDTAEGREQNRRIEFSILSPEELVGDDNNSGMVGADGKPATVGAHLKRDQTSGEESGGAE